MPWPTPLVVKNGSKRCWRTSSFMPVPVSRMEIRMYGPGRSSAAQCGHMLSQTPRPVSTVNVPPWGMASRAFAARLIMTCSIWCRSASTGPSPGSSLVTISMSSPTSGRSIVSMSGTISLGSMRFGLRTCLRLKASN